VYAVWKLVHVVGVIFWIGPPIGAYLMLARAHRSGDRARVRLLERETELVLRLEHVAFVVLLASGAAMVAVAGAGALQWPWLRFKLVAVAYIVAFEVLDVVVEHGVTRRVYAADDPRAHPEWGKMLARRKLLALAALPVVVVALPAALWLAVTKP
jgi:uncharacterized membrane protein